MVLERFLDELFRREDKIKDLLEEKVFARKIASQRRLDESLGVFVIDVEWTTRALCSCCSENLHQATFVLGCKYRLESYELGLYIDEYSNQVSENTWFEDYWD